MTNRQLIPDLGHLTPNVARLLQPYFPEINVGQVPIRVGPLRIPGMPDASAVTSLWGTITILDRVWWEEDAGVVLRLLVHELDHVVYLRTRGLLGKLWDGLHVLLLSARYLTWYPSQAIPVENQAQDRKAAIILDIKSQDRSQLGILDQCA